jgi:hypothetical protein
MVALPQIKSTSYLKGLRGAHGVAGGAAGLAGN